MTTGTTTDRREANRRIPSGAAGDRRLRIGVVGAGKMGMAHAAVIGRGSSPAKLAAVVDPDEGRRSELLEVAGVSGFSSLSEMLEGEVVDVVHVCTPPEAHVPAAREAIAAGKHVYVEKPFAPTRSEAVQLLELARARGVLVCCGHQLLENAAIRRFQELATHVGTAVHVESYFSFNPVRRGADGRAPLGEDLQLLDILPHPVYLAIRALSLAEPDGSVEIQAVEVGRGGTVHALLRSGSVTACLVVTLRGRPIENHLKVVGDRGMVQADLVRGTVQALLGSGTSGISKASNPFRVARQLAFGTASALTRRVIRREIRYPGLAELVGGFHRAVRDGGPSPVADEEILGTVEVCERVSRELDATAERAASAASGTGGRIVVTGGTGFLGRRVVRELAERGMAPVVLARRTPPPWDRLQGVEYHPFDLGNGGPERLLGGADAVLHLAAATSGGFEDHRRDSVGATEHLVRAMGEVGVDRLIHISSLGVLQRDPGTGGVSDRSDLVDDPEAAGPYAWGKAEAERVARELAGRLRIQLRVLRPGPIVDFDRLDPPGRLGRLLGDRLFVMVGSRSESIPTISVADLARMIVDALERFEAVPAAVNLVDDPPRTRGQLVDLMRSGNPDLRVVRLPRWLFAPLAVCTTGALRLLGRGESLPDLRRAFASDPMDFGRPAVFRQG